MDPTTAVVVGILGGVLAALMGSWASYHLSQGKIRDAEERAAVSSRTITAVERAALAAGRGKLPHVTYQVKEHQVEWRFEHGGEGVKTVRVLGVQARQHVTDLRIPFYESGNSRTILGKPVVSPLGDCGFPVTLDEVHTTYGEHAINGRFIVHGLLTPESSPVSFLLQVAFSNMFASNLEQARDDFAQDTWKEDYARAGIHCPTDHLVMSVVFPRSFVAFSSRPQPVAFFAHSEVVHQDETTRLRTDPASFAFFDGTATLSVVRPAVGLQYAISWLPPSAHPAPLARLN